MLTFLGILKPVDLSISFKNISLYSWKLVIVQPYPYTHNVSVKIFSLFKNKRSNTYTAQIGELAT